MDEDEFAALYGDVGPDNGSNKIQASPEKAAAPSGAVAEDEAELFMQLYGDQPPPDEPAKEIVTEPQNLLAGTFHSFCLIAADVSL